MAKLGADLEYGKLHVDPWGRLWCAGWDSGSIYLEMSSRADLTCETLTGGSHKKLICNADAQQPGLAVRHDGAVYIEVAEGGGLVHYRVAHIAWPAVRIDSS